MSTPSEEAAATLIALPTNNCARCMLFLKLADIPPTEIQIKSPADYGGLRSAEYQKINPQAKFPAYISKDQNFALFEAQVILDYLADAWAGAPRGASASGASASQLSQYHDPQQRALSRLMIQVHDIYLSSPNCTAKGFFGTQGVLYRADMGVAERKSRMGEMQKQLDVLEGLCKQARAAEGNEDCGRRDASIYLPSPVLGSLGGAATPTTVSPLHLETRDFTTKDGEKVTTKAFVTKEGRQTILHGTNAVVKGPPWVPDSQQFSADISLSKKDFEWMQELGLNFLRLGVLWPAYEPIQKQYDETYLERVEKIVTMAGQHGVYVLLDAHQDGFSEYFCGEGFPTWAVQQRPNSEKAYPAGPGWIPSWIPGGFEYGTPLTNDDYYHVTIPLPTTSPHGEELGDARFPTRQACATKPHGPGWGETTFAVSYAWQGLYDNWNGTADAFAAFWARVATRFRDRPEIVGLNLMNEPWAGDIYSFAHPFLWNPSSDFLSFLHLNADFKNLQPLYKKISDKIRATGNEDVILFAPGVTFGDFGSGFTENVGGSADNTVFDYHFYDPVQPLGAEFQVKKHVEKAGRLRAGAMMTESHHFRPNSSRGEPMKAESCESALTTAEISPKNDIAAACDKYLQGWADWEWKTFYRNEDHTPHSQNAEFGSSKTGIGCKWPSDKNGEPQPPPYFFTALARTYAPLVAGQHLLMEFDAKTGDFHLEFAAGDFEKTGGVTEIYVSERRYAPYGVDVSVSGAFPEGSVRVEYDGSHVVRLQGGVGLQEGTKVTVNITKKVKL